MAQARGHTPAGRDADIYVAADQNRRQVLHELTLKKLALALGRVVGATARMPVVCMQADAAPAATAGMAGSAGTMVAGERDGGMASITPDGSLAQRVEVDAVKVALRPEARLGELLCVQRVVHKRRGEEVGAKLRMRCLQRSSVYHYEGERGAERKVRAVSASGAVVKYFEGARGVERVVRWEFDGPARPQ